MAFRSLPANQPATQDVLSAASPLCTHSNLDKLQQRMPAPEPQQQRTCTISEWWCTWPRTRAPGGKRGQPSRVATSTYPMLSLRPLTTVLKGNTPTAGLSVECVESAGEQLISQQQLACLNNSLTRGRACNPAPSQQQHRTHPWGRRPGRAAAGCCATGRAGRHTRHTPRPPPWRTPPGWRAAAGCRPAGRQTCMCRQGHMGRVHHAVLVQQPGPFLPCILPLQLSGWSQGWSDGEHTSRHAEAG